MRAALHEAAELYMQAKTLSDNQVRSELMESWMLDSRPAGATSQAEEATTDASRLTSFWVEQGLTEKQAGRVSQEILKRDAYADVSQVAAKISILYRILPEGDVAAMVCKDVSVLDVDPNVAVRNLVILVEAFANRDVVEMVSKQPSLLTVDDLEARINRSVQKLVEIHPSKSAETVKNIIEEHPQLLNRMDYYSHVTSLEDLPIDIQNMMIIADQGLGFLHRYYKNQRQAASN